MKTHLKTLSKAFGMLLLLMVAATSSCKKEKKITPDPVTTSLSGTIDGKTLKLDASNLTSTYYTTAGDPVKSLETSATLNASGDKLNFFLDDIKNGTLALTKKAGTSFAPGRTIKINATEAGGGGGVQTYVSYFSAGNTYYAYSGSIEITISDTEITVKWSISFKDAAGREFTSSGSFTIVNYISNPKPKSEVKDPTPVAAKPTIENIAPTAGMAGDTVSITGTNYSTVLSENDVKFNGVTATLKSATATRIVAFAPQTGTTGAVTVKVKNSDVTTGPTFTYVQPATVTGIAPTSARVGDTVTITGTNFSTVLAENSVAFAPTQNRVPGTVIAATTSQLKVKVPQGAATGTVAVRVRSGATVTTGEFVVNATPPPVNTGNWQDVGFTVNIGDINVSASSGKSLMFFSKGRKDLYYSADGLSYMNVIDSLPFADKQNLSLNALVVDNTTYYIATNRGVAKSANGKTWKLLNPFPNAPTTGFNAIIARRNTVVLINDFNLFTSTDQGETWSTDNAIKKGGAVRIDYIISDSGGKYFYGIDAQGNSGDGVTKTVYKSTDQGHTWSAENEAVTGTYFYNGGYPEFFKSSNNYQFLLYAPGNSNSVTTQRLYRTTNQGNTWTKLSDDMTYFVNAGGPFVAFGYTSLHLSSDEGATFKTVAIPDTYAIGGYTKTDDYTYIFCLKPGTTTHKIFRMANQ